MFSKFPWIFGRAQPIEPDPVPCDEPEADESDRVGSGSYASARRRISHGPLREMRFSGLRIVVPDKYGDAIQPIMVAIASVRHAKIVPSDVLARAISQCLTQPVSRCRGGRCGR
jgi:hypothetical protein